jgi:hypothetical protein
MATMKGGRAIVTETVTLNLFGVYPLSIRESAVQDVLAP